MKNLPAIIDSFVEKYEKNPQVLLDSDVKTLGRMFVNNPTTKHYEIFVRLLKMLVADPEQIIGFDYKKDKNSFLLRYIRDPIFSKEIVARNNYYYNDTNERPNSFKRKAEFLLKAVEFVKKYNVKDWEQLRFLNNNFNFPLDLETYEKIDIKGLLNYYAKASYDKSELIEEFLFPSDSKAKIVKALANKVNLNRLGKKRAGKLTKIFKVARVRPLTFIKMLYEEDVSTINELYRKLEEYGQHIVDELSKENRDFKTYAMLVFKHRPYYEAWQFDNRTYRKEFFKALKAKKNLKKFKLKYNDLVFFFSPSMYVQLAAKDIIRSCVSLLEPSSYSMLKEMQNPNETFCLVFDKNKLVGRFRVYKKGSLLGRISNVYTIENYELDESVVDYVTKLYAELNGAIYVDKPKFVGMLLNKDEGLILDLD